ncbi:hypothetical protein I7I48_08554 [Histoplasma ohiense]|nr:hypothetical protein I7I48_08554 [Histoplasma ohiense (nom. inval.)]
MFDCSRITLVLSSFSDYFLLFPYSYMGLRYSRKVVCIKPLSPQHLWTLTQHLKPIRTESSSHNRGVCWASMGLMNKILLQCASNAEDIVAKEGAVENGIVTVDDRGGVKRVLGCDNTGEPDDAERSLSGSDLRDAQLPGFGQRNRRQGR